MFVTEHKELAVGSKLEKSNATLLWRLAFELASQGHRMMTSKDAAPMPSPHSPNKNHILAALPLEDYARLLPDLELIPMPLGGAVYESGGPLGYLYFPTTSIVSLLYVMENGASAEIAITGNEGMVGISLFMGGESTPSRAVVQSAGNGYRLRATSLRREFALGGNLQHLALRFTQALITQMAQTAVNLNQTTVTQPAP
jgi:hypothetical protein